MKKMNLKQMVFLAILGAWAVVMRLFDFPILPLAPFLKVDFSDLVVLIGLLVNGPIGAILVAAIRDISSYIMKGGEAGIPIGASMSFIASLAYILPVHLILLKGKNWNKFIKYSLMVGLSSVSMTFAMSLLNYFIALPLYIKILNFPIESIKDYVLSLIMPFNLIKGGIVSVGLILVLQIISPIIHKRNFGYIAYSEKTIHPQKSLMSHSKLHV